MVNARDAAVFTLILIGGLGVFIGVGGLQLGGTQAANLLCELPVTSGTDYCSSDVKPSTQYQLTTNLVVNSAGEDGSFKYKTSREDLTFSFGSSASLSVIGANEVVVDYILIEDGKVIGSDRKRLGNIEAPNTKDVTFTSSSLDSGTYTVKYIIRSNYCSALGVIINDCQQQEHVVEKTIEVPKLPLGEY